MKSNYFKRMLAAAIVCTGFTAQAQISVTATAGVLGPTAYTTLDAAFIAINAGTHQGAITVDVNANTTEVGPCVLNSGDAAPAVYTSVMIRPVVDGVSISGPTATGRGLIELKGADDVTIDGDNPNTTGTNRNLSIVNTASNTTTFTSCVRIATSAAVTSANNVIIRNCNITGSATGRNIAAATSAAGSENTTFGIYSGGNGGATATDAPTAITNVTTNTAPAGTTVNALLVDNNSIVSVARGIAFAGANATVSNGVTITNNTIGGAGTLSGAPPFTTPSNTVYTKGIWIGGTTAVTITGNTLRNILAYAATQITGIELANNIGNGGVTISNNSVTGICQNSSSANAVRAIAVLNSSSAYTIANNTISNVQGIMSGVSSATTTVGIEVNTAAPSGTIELNKINQVYNRNPGTTAAYGINLVAGSNVTIRNNFISDIIMNMAGGFAFDPLYSATGIRVVTGVNHRIYYNSVNMFGPLIGAANSSILTSALAIISTASTGADIRNNILVNTITGGTTQIAHVSLFLPSGATSAMNLTLNNNVYYTGTGAPHGIGQAGYTAGTNFYLPGNFNPASTTPATNMRAYTNTLSVAGTNDNASFASTAAAPFVSNSDLHINLSAPNVGDVDAKAAVIGTVPLDIDGNTRDVTTPDIGADEFVNPICTGADGGTIAPPTASVCAGQTIAMSSTGASTGLGITYQWMVGTAPGGPYANVVGGTGATTTSYTSGALTAGTYYYVLQTTCSNGSITDLSNELTVTVNALPTVSATPSSTLLCNGSAPVTLNATGASTYSWAPATGLSGTTGSTVTSNPLSSITYIVTGTDANGCIDTGIAVISMAPAVTGLAATASSAAICIGDSVDLGSSANATVNVLSENFSNDAPAWTITNAMTSPSVSNFATVNSPFSYVMGSLNFSNFSTPNGGKFLMSNSDAGGSGTTTNTVLTSPVFSTMGMTSANLTYEHLYQRWASGDITVRVEISTNGGQSWSTLIDYITIGTDQGTTTAGAQVATTANINLAAYLNQSNLKIRFNYVATWGYYWILDNIQVNGAMTNTYAWTSNPAGFTSSLQNPADVIPTATTDYIVTATNGQGCTANDMVTVTVNPLPSVTASASDSTICTGDSVMVMGSGATSYTWSGGVMDAVNFSPAMSGTYSVTGTDANGCMDTASIMITVNTLPTVTASASDSTICVGDSIMVMGGGAMSYSWTGGVTDAMNFAPVVSETYTVTGTDANGCMNTASIMVTVNALPAVTANASAMAVCSGDSTTLYGTGTASSYTWNGGVTDSVAFVPASSFTYVVMGMDSMTGCSNWDSVMVTVNPLPTVTASASDTMICTGDSVMVMGGGALNYSWSDSLVDGVNFAPSVSDTYVVIGTDINGCVNMDSVMITVNPLPVVTASVSDPEICAGDSVMVTGSGAMSYSWTGGVTDGVNFAPVASNSYIVTGTDANGCTDTASVMITVNPLPNVTVSISTDTICVDDASITLSGATPAGGSWSGNGVTGTTFSPSGATVGTHAITYTFTDGNGCTNMASDNIVVDACVGVIEQVAVTGVNIFPNPNMGSFSITLSAMPVKPLQVELLNALGQVVDAFTMNGTTKNVDITSLEGGIYLLRITNGEAVSMYRVVKQ